MKKSLKSKWVGLTLAGLGAAAISGSALANMRVESHGGLTVFDPADCGGYWFKIGGLLQIDEVVFTGKHQAKRSDFPTGANIRRSWVDLKGGVGDFWTYRLTLDFRGLPVVIRDAHINYTGFENVNLSFGQFFIPFGLENWGDKKDLLFLEQSLMGTAFLAPEFGLGIYADTNFCDMFTVAAAVYQPRQVARSFGVRDFAIDRFGFSIRPAPRNDRVGEALRITFSPIHSDCTVVHFGISGKNQELITHDGNGLPTFTSIFQTFPEAVGRITALLVNAGPLRAKSFSVGGLEFGAVWGPTMIQAEYEAAKVRLHRDNFVTVTPGNNRHGGPRFNGWHIQGSYILTGESHGYNFQSGTFCGVRPTCEYGAWEVAARYSSIDLNKKRIYGGREKDLTLGLNWYVNDNVRVMFNYILANIHPTNTNIRRDHIRINHVFTENVLGHAGTQPVDGNARKRRLNIFGLRLQAAF